MDVVAAVAVGLAAGVVAGMLGVGGGILFVPGLALFLGLSQLEAAGTSLLAMIPVAIVGAARQQRYGNLRLREGGLVGTLAAGGVFAGVVLANRLPERALEIGFAVVLLVTAAQLVRRAFDDEADNRSSSGSRHR
jgi:uncharacterized membrane protein YfcA